MAQSRVAGGRRARFSAASAEETMVLNGVAKREISLHRGSRYRPKQCLPIQATAYASLRPLSIQTRCWALHLRLGWSHVKQNRKEKSWRRRKQGSAHILLANVRQGLTTSTAVNCARMLGPTKSRSHVTAVTLHVLRARTNLLLIQLGLNRLSNTLGRATLITTAPCFVAAERLSYRRQDTVIRGEHFVLTRRLGPP
jgi:hypothetical protein